MTRNGKIARLPRDLREQLNHRLADGELGTTLVQWLNTLPEVKKVLAEHFGGRPINEINLTDWKQGGFAEWLCHEDARNWVAQFVEESDVLQGDSGAVSLADRAAIPVTIALHRLLERGLASDNPAQQTRTIVAAAQQLTQLRRANRELDRIRLEEQHLALKQQEAAWLAKLRAANRPDLCDNDLPED